MKTVRGPGLFLAQFAGDAAPYDSLPEIARVGIDPVAVASAMGLTE